MGYEMKALKLFGWGCLVAGVIGLSLYVNSSLRLRDVTATKRPVLTPEQEKVDVQRTEGDKLYASQPEKAKKHYEKIVKENKSVKDPKIQDVVATSRMKLGYLAAHKNDFKGARQQFLESAKEYKGTGVKSPDYGSLPDQAEYQAAVCLMADGKEEEAKAAFVSFLKTRWDSPLIHGAYQRLQRLGGDDEETTALLQTAVAKQEEAARFESVVCGPKAIVKLLTYLNKPWKSYQEIAKLCETGERGTSIEGMRNGMKALGVPTFAFVVNRKDFESLPLHSIWLNGDHFFILLSVENGKARVFDPTSDGERMLPLPPVNDSTFSAPVITLELPTFMEKSTL
jgi:hypothetical protein